MRITNKMLVNHSLSNLQGNLRRLSRTNEQLASGKKILRPSDDPVGITNVLKYTANRREIEQHLSNVDRGIGYLETADSALAELGEVLQRGRELAVQGSNGALDERARAAIADEVQQLLDHVIQIGNSTFADEYMFGYAKTDTAPFQLDKDGNILFLERELISVDGVIDDTYLGELASVQGSGIEIGVGITLDFRIGGDDAFTTAMSALLQLNHALTNADGDVNATLSQFDVAIDDALRSRSEAGAKLSGWK